jgi:hypothetical protein
MAGVPISKTSADTSVTSLGGSTIAAVYWLNPANVGDTLTLQNDNGTTLLSLRCEVAGQSQVFQIPFQVNGFKLSQISSGTVYIYTN